MKTEEELELDPDKRNQLIVDLMILSHYSGNPRLPEDKNKALCLEQSTILEKLGIIGSKSDGLFLMRCMISEKKRDEIYDTLQSNTQENRRAN